MEMLIKNMSPKRYSATLSVYFQLCCGHEASQIVEFAVTLPILMVIVIGITDFGTAFSLKQTLNNAAREGARSASRQSMSDVSNNRPPSIDAIHDAVDNYLAASNINDCGLSGAIPAKSGVGLIWTYTANTNCPGNGTLTLTIDRATTFQTTGGTVVTIENTHVQISYPYQWRFGSFIQFFVPSANYASGVTQITADALMTNLS
jgi:Flp pilus assembly protein TadG